ncbi:MAG: flavin reductase family protein [Balneolales bacterium]|nr:flavin reductase family protein [Balneolales bacterium]
MDFNPALLSKKERYKLLIGSVIPRPIALVSTADKEGTNNLAPYSFFTVACISPMVIAFFPLRYKKDKELKDSLVNILQTKEFVVNIASRSIVEQLNLSSGLYEKGQDEFEISGLTPVPSAKVNPPGVGECLVRLECRLYKTLSLGEDDGGSNAIFGEVVHLYADDEVCFDGKLDERKIDPLSRLAGIKYATLGETIEINRPALKK